MSHATTCPFCGSAREKINPEAPFDMYGCGTRVWHSTGKPSRSPQCYHDEPLKAAQDEIDHLQHDHRPPVPR